MKVGSQVESYVRIDFAGLDLRYSNLSLTRRPSRGSLRVGLMADADTARTGLEARRLDLGRPPGMKWAAGLFVPPKSEPGGGAVD